MGASSSVVGGDIVDRLDRTACGWSVTYDAPLVYCVSSVKASVVGSGDVVDGAACGWLGGGGGSSNGFLHRFVEAACGWPEDDEAACGWPLVAFLGLSAESGGDPAFVRTDIRGRRPEDEEAFDDMRG